MVGATAPSAAPPPPRFSNLDIALIVLLALLWGSAYIFIREGLLLGASPFPFAALRYALSAAAFFAIAAGRRSPFPSRSALLASAGISGTLFIGLYGGFLYWGEQYTTGGYASVLSATAPILTVVVAYAILPQERLSGLALAGIAIGFLGTLVLVVPELWGGSIGAWPGPEFVIAAFVCAAFGTVLLRRFGGGPQGLWQIGAQFATGAVILGVATVALPFPRALPLTGPILAALFALVAFSSVAGYFVYFRLHHQVGPVRANTIAYLLPLAGIGIGTGIFGEPISAWEIAGFLIVVLGVTLVIRDRSRSAPTEAHAT
jgi:probable blue pigment (indigoidine) exporter